jgi:hypothetical protein
MVACMGFSANNLQGCSCNMTPHIGEDRVCAGHDQVVVT